MVSGVSNSRIVYFMATLHTTKAGAFVHHHVVSADGISTLPGHVTLPPGPAVSPPARQQFSFARKLHDAQAVGGVQVSLSIDGNAVGGFLEQRVPWRVADGGKHAALRIEFLNPVQLVVRDVDSAIGVHGGPRYRGASQRFARDAVECMNEPAVR